MSIDIRFYGSRQTETCPVCGHEHPCSRKELLYDRNITSNFWNVAEESGVAQAIWNTGDAGLTKASDLVQFLEPGLEQLKAAPDYFRQFDDPDGWGTYRQFVTFVEEYLEACRRYPDATVEIS